MRRATPSFPFVLCLWLALLWQLPAARAWQWEDRHTESDSLRLGDPVRLSLTVSAAAGETVSWPLPGREVLGGWRLLGADSLKEENTIQGRRITRVLSLARYTLGEALLPTPGPLNADSTAQVDSLRVTVIATLPDSAQAADILEPARLAHSLGWWVIRIALGLAAALLLCWAWRRWRSRVARPKDQPPVPPDPWRDFEAALARIEVAALWRVQRTEEHYAELSLALRGLLEDCLGLPCRERSTEELRDLLRDTPLNEGDLAELLRLLEENDWVKYARRWPDGETSARQVERYRAWALLRREVLLERHRLLLSRHGEAAA